MGRISVLPCGFPGRTEKPLSAVECYLKQIGSEDDWRRVTIVDFTNGELLNRDGRIVLAYEGSSSTIALTWNPSQQWWRNSTGTHFAIVAEENNQGTGKKLPGDFSPEVGRTLYSAAAADKGDEAKSWMANQLAEMDGCQPGEVDLNPERELTVEQVDYLLMMLLFKTGKSQTIHIMDGWTVGTFAEELNKRL